MKNYLNFENDIKDLENELDKLKDPYNQGGLSEVDTDRISKTQDELDQKLKEISDKKNIQDQLLKDYKAKILEADKLFSENKFQEATKFIYIIFIYIIFNIFSVVYEIVAFFLYIKNRKQLKKLTEKK